MDQEKYKVTIDGTVYEVEVEKMTDSSLNETKNISQLNEYEESIAKNNGKNRKKNNKVKKEKKEEQSQQKKSTNSAKETEIVKAPMSGKILEVNMTNGDKVEADEIVMIMEAMKMENEINAPVSGNISKLYVAKSDNVSSGDKLFEIGG